MVIIKAKTSQIETSKSMRTGFLHCYFVIRGHFYTMGRSENRKRGKKENIENCMHF